MSRQLAHSRAISTGVVAAMVPSPPNPMMSPFRSGHRRRETRGVMALKEAMRPPAKPTPMRAPGEGQHAERLGGPRRSAPRRPPRGEARTGPGAGRTGRGGSRAGAGRARSRGSRPRSEAPGLPHRVRTRRRSAADHRVDGTVEIGRGSSRLRTEGRPPQRARSCYGDVSARRLPIHGSLCGWQAGMERRPGSMHHLEPSCDALLPLPPLARPAASSRARESRSGSARGLSRRDAPMRREPAPGGGAVLVGPDRLIVLGPGPEPGRPPRRVRHGRPRAGSRSCVRVSRGRGNPDGTSPTLRSSGRGRSGCPPPTGSRSYSAPRRGRPRRRRAGGLCGRLQHAVFRTPEPEPLLSFWSMKRDSCCPTGWRTTPARLPPVSSGPIRSITPSRAFRASRPAFDQLRARNGWLERSARLGGSLRRAPRPHLVGPGAPRPGQQPLPHDRDPDGNRIEISAEMEHLDHDVPHRVWPQEERTLNLWGTAWMRA